MKRPRVERIGGGVARLVALLALLNAFAYTLVVANPLVQSDLWRMLDGFLGRFIDQGFRWADVFVEPYPSDTNLPLFKLFLFFNVRWFALDLRIEAVLAVLVAALGVWMLVWFAGRTKEGHAVEKAWLLAVLALVWLSLNASATYAWPLALSWHVPVTLSIAYFCMAMRASLPLLVAVTALLGILLDEFAYPVVLAACIARMLAGGEDKRRLVAVALSIALGLLASRVFYGVWEWAAASPPGGADAAVEMSRSLTGLLSLRAWKAVAFPLTDSMVHVDNLGELFGHGAGSFRWMIAIALIMAHGWFWLTICKLARRRQGDNASYLATATMLLGYAMVAGVLLQRVPQLGFDYLHQPRYVLFYQINLLALAILAFRRVLVPTRLGSARRILLPALGIALLCLQLGLSALAWSRARESGGYYEKIAAEIGRVAADPGREHACEAIVRVCAFPVDQRRRIMARLTRQQLNLFSPRFQRLHRLEPGAGAAQPQVQ